MYRLLLIVLVAGSSWAQTTFTVSDTTMKPMLQADSTYAYTVFADSLVYYETIVIVSQGGAQHARCIIGLPDDKDVLFNDSDHSLQRPVVWSFWGIDDDVIYWVGKDHPVPTDDTESGPYLFSMPYADYLSASALGGYYVKALKRPTISEGATRTAAQGADSREWGVISSSDIVGIITLDP